MNTPFLPPGSISVPSEGRLARSKPEGSFLIEMALVLSRRLSTHQRREIRNSEVNPSLTRHCAGTLAEVEELQGFHGLHGSSYV